LKELVPTDVAVNVPDTRFEPVVSVVEAPEFEKKFVNIGVVVEMRFPLALTARNVFERLVNLRPVNVEVAVTVNPVDEAVPKVVWPDTVSVEIVVVARVLVPVTVNVPATASNEPGVVEPTPTLPLFNAVNIVDEAYESTEKPGSVEVAQTVKVAFGAVLLPMLTLGVRMFP
jgi:hypothetical protein